MSLSFAVQVGGPHHGAMVARALGCARSFGHLVRAGVKRLKRNLDCPWTRCVQDDPSRVIEVVGRFMRG